MAIVPLEALVEAIQERWWRFRCGEPHLDRYPVRCRRDLNHPSPHIGLDSELAVWDGTGNPVSAQVGGTGHYRCWGYCERPGHRP
jgi:hypothetical protein